MPVAIVPKKNSQSGYRPVANELQTGELALNTADAALYTKTSGGTVVQLNPTTLTTQQIAGRAFAASLLFGR